MGLECVVQEVGKTNFGRLWFSSCYMPSVHDEHECFRHFSCVRRRR